MKLIDHRFTSKKEKKKLSKTHYNKTAKIKAKAKKIVIYKGVPKNYQCISQQKFENRYTCVPHPDPSSLLPPSTIPLAKFPLSPEFHFILGTIVSENRLRLREERGLLNILLDNKMLSFFNAFKNFSCLYSVTLL